MDSYFFFGIYYWPLICGNGCHPRVKNFSNLNKELLFPYNMNLGGSVKMPRIVIFNKVEFAKWYGHMMATTNTIMWVPRHLVEAQSRNL